VSFTTLGETRGGARFGGGWAMMSGLSNGSNGKWWDLVGLGGSAWSPGNEFAQDQAMEPEETKEAKEPEPPKERSCGGLEKKPYKAFTKPLKTHVFCHCY
jgi:hypothetical protein